MRETPIILLVVFYRVHCSIITTFTPCKSLWSRLSRRQNRRLNRIFFRPAAGGLAKLMAAKPAAYRSTADDRRQDHNNTVENDAKFLSLFDSLFHSQSRHYSQHFYLHKKLRPITSVELRYLTTCSLPICIILYT